MILFLPQKIAIMKIEQIYTGCLSHAAYYFESQGESAIFDPLREVKPYLEMATKYQSKIKYIFETHFHADFVSGHLELANKTDAKIIYGPTASPDFEAIIAYDGEVFKVGNCQIQAIHTPGHTLESTTYLIIDEKGRDHGIITGDTLFIGDVGRPDLAQHLIPELTEQLLAKKLYHSLRTKIMPLADDLMVYPNHGAGSACGKNMSIHTMDTLGHQKEVNYALNSALTEEDFIKEVLSGLLPPPSYFLSNVLLNKGGYESLDHIYTRGLQPLTPFEFDILRRESAIVLLDTRDAEDFSKGFIPKSLNIGLNGNFAQWAGELIQTNHQRILLITYKEEVEQAITRLARIGYDGVIGFLEDGFESWSTSGHKVETIDRITAGEFEYHYQKNATIIDVRKKSEFESEHILNAINIPLHQLKNKLNQISKESPFMLICAGGYRSMMAASILKQNGFENFLEVRGGLASISKTNVPITEFICPTSLL